jgi:hypothetical protein
VTVLNGLAIPTRAITSILAMGVFASMNLSRDILVVLLDIHSINFLSMVLNHGEAFCINLRFGGNPFLVSEGMSARFGP